MRKIQTFLREVLFKVPTIPTMSDYEEDLDDFQTFSAENATRPAESLVGA